MSACTNDKTKSGKLAMFKCRHARGSL